MVSSTDGTSVVFAPSTSLPATIEFEIVRYAGQLKYEEEMPPPPLARFPMIVLEVTPALKQKLTPPPLPNVPFSEIVLELTDTSAASIPPPLLVAQFPEIVLELTDAWYAEIPPPDPNRPVTEFSAIVLELIVTPPKLAMPPPSVAAEFPKMVLELTVSQSPSSE